MRIHGQEADILWEVRPRPANERLESDQGPGFGEYIALITKEGGLIASKTIYGLYADEREIDSFAEWLKMSQDGSPNIQNVYGGNTSYGSFDFTEPDLGLRRQSLPEKKARLIFIFDWREDDPVTFSITANEQELARAADEYLQEQKVTTDDYKD